MSGTAPHTTDGGGRKRSRQADVVDINHMDIAFDEAASTVKKSGAAGGGVVLPLPPLSTAAADAAAKAEAAQQFAEGADPFFLRQQNQKVEARRPWAQQQGTQQRRTLGSVFAGHADGHRARAAAPAQTTDVRTAADDLVMNSRAVTETPFERAENFRAAMRRLCHRAFPPLWSCSTPPSTVSSAVDANIITSVEPWDVPFMGSVNPPSCSNLIHHPIIPAHPLVDDERLGEILASSVGGMKLVKTKEELRAERRKAAQEKQEMERRAAAAAKAAPGGNTSAAAHHDQLRWKNLNDSGRMQQLVNDPHALHEAIEQQYRERFDKHMRENYDRHVAAIPHQAAKKDLDAWRRAEEKPRMHVYHVPRARNAECINRLRNFANDSRLRGFFLWIAEEELLVILAGGEVAMRHLDRWIVEKAEWHRAGRQVSGGIIAQKGAPPPADGTVDAATQAGSTTTTTTGAHLLFSGQDAPKVHRMDPSLLERTQGRLVLSMPLLRVGDLSFLLPPKSLDAICKQRRTSGVEEPVFVRHCDTIEAAFEFVSGEMPAGGILPPSFLSFVWRAVFHC